MDSEYTRSPSSHERSPHKNLLARAIAERRITASATYLPPTFSLDGLPPIPELSSFQEAHAGEDRDFAHSTPATAVDSPGRPLPMPQPYLCHSARDAPTRGRDHHSRHADESRSQRTGSLREVMYTADMPEILHDKSNFVMLYLTISGPPMYSDRSASGILISAGVFHRAWASACFRPPHVRAELRAQGRWDPFAWAFREQRTLSESQLYNTDLRDVATALPLHTTHKLFWKYLWTLYSAEVCNDYHIVQWVIECPVCSEEVVGYASDPQWNGRYIYHRENCCVASERSRSSQRRVNF